MDILPVSESQVKSSCPPTMIIVVKSIEAHQEKNTKRAECIQRERAEKAIDMSIKIVHYDISHAIFCSCIWCKVSQQNASNRVSIYYLHYEYKWRYWINLYHKMLSLVVFFLTSRSFFFTSHGNIFDIILGYSPVDHGMILNVPAYRRYVLIYLNTIITGSAEITSL